VAFRPAAGIFGAEETLFPKDPSGLDMLASRCLPKRPIRSAVLLLIAAGAVAVGVWAIRRGTADPPVSFKTVRLDRGPVEQAVTATGSVSAVVTVQVGSQVSGVIAKLGADFNSKVTAGQIIAQIDATRFKATLAQFEASLSAAVAAKARAEVAVRQAKLDLDRTQALVTRQVVGAADLDLARTKYDQAVADVAAAVAQGGQARASVGAARVDLERTTIRAPISGTVLQRAVDVGQTVAASLQAPVLFTIAQDLSRMEVHAAIDEADVGKLREGQVATFTVDAYPGEVFHATIFQIRSQPNVQQNVVTYDGVVRFDNPNGKLRPGMTATVRVVSARKEDVLRVPNAALRFKPAADLIAEGTPRGSAGNGPSGDRSSGPGSSGPGSSGPGSSGPGTAAGGTSVAGTSGDGPSPGTARSGGAGAARPGATGASGGDGGRRGGGARGRGRVFQLAGDHVVAVSFKSGISDDEFTEVAGGGLQPGDEVVLDVAGGQSRSSSGSRSGSGGGSRGPPRIF
jgi:HlyD family secretion protein